VFFSRQRCICWKKSPPPPILQLKPFLGGKCEKWRMEALECIRERKIKERKTKNGR
jgi:hypothetical protein